MCVEEEADRSSGRLEPTGPSVYQMGHPAFVDGRIFIYVIFVELK